jgi:hypothetical protein
MIRPNLELWSDFPQYTAAKSQEALNEVVDEIESAGVTEFLAKVPEFVKTDKNAMVLHGWTYTRGVPFTLWNAVIAYRALREEVSLETTPQESPEVDTSRGIIEVRTDALAEYRPGSEEAETLAKLADDSTLSDKARKNRDDRLKILAGQQRRQYADPRKPTGHEPTLVI